MPALKSPCGICPATLSYAEWMSASEAFPDATELNTCDNVSCKPIVSLPCPGAQYHPRSRFPRRHDPNGAVPDGTGRCPGFAAERASELRARFKRMASGGVTREATQCRAKR